MRPVLLLALLLAAAPASAEVELGFYGGWAGGPDGDVTVGGGAGDRDLSLDGGLGVGSQVGARVTWWSQSNFGIALDYSRFGESDGEAGLSFGRLETLTLGGVRRWQDAFGNITPYVGAGLGLAMASIEVDGVGPVDATGPAVSWVAGASVPIRGNWSLFGEYEGTYADVEGTAAGGGTVESETLTNSINLGVSFSF